MNIFHELEKHLTFSHPKLEVRGEILKSIKHTKKWDKKKKKIAKQIKLESKDSNKSGQKIEKPQKTNKINDIINELNKVAPKKKAGLVSLRYKQAKIKDSIDLPKKREASDTCFFCGWKYPCMLTQDEINKHANLCIDGKGRENIEEHEKSLKAIKITDSSSENNDEKELEKLEMRLMTKCPYCHLRIGNRSDEFQETHLKECEAELVEKSKTKSLTEELGIIPKKTIETYRKEFMQRKKFI